MQMYLCTRGLSFIPKADQPLKKRRAACKILYKKEQIGRKKTKGILRRREKTVSNKNKDKMSWVA